LSVGASTRTAPDTLVLVQDRDDRRAFFHHKRQRQPDRNAQRFLTAAERGKAWAPPEGAWGILARAREDTQDERLLESLRREHPMPGLRAIRRARVWWLWSQDPSHGSGVLGELRDPKHGLLVNPHAEASMVLTGPVAWSRVERFLTEPAPAFRAAA